MTQDTRKDRRVKIVSLNVRYKSATVDEFIDNHALDVSRGGIYIKTNNPFSPGTLLKFEIRLVSDQAVITGVGRVVWKREAVHGSQERPPGMGVKFIKVDDPSRALIDKLVNTRADAGKAFESEPEAKTSSGTPKRIATPPTVHAATRVGTPSSPSMRKGTIVGLGATAGSASVSGRAQSSGSATGSGAAGASRTIGTPPLGSPSVGGAASAGATVRPGAPDAPEVPEAPGATVRPGPDLSGASVRPDPEISGATVRPGAPSSSPAQGASGSEPQSASVLPRGPSVPPRPGPAAANMFPKRTSSSIPPKGEATVMKQAAELLEEALREAGGSMDDVGTNPLFSGGSAPAESLQERAAALAAELPIGSSPRTESPGRAEPTAGADDAANARAMVAAMAPGPIQRRHAEAVGLPSDTTARARYGNLRAPVAERDGAAAVSNRKKGSATKWVLLLAAAALGATVFAFRAQILGTVGAQSMKSSPPPEHAAAPATPPISTPAAPPSPIASASATPEPTPSASAATTATPEPSASSAEIAAGAPSAAASSALPARASPNTFVQRPVVASPPAAVYAAPRARPATAAAAPTSSLNASEPATASSAAAPSKESEPGSPAPATSSQPPGAAAPVPTGGVSGGSPPSKSRSSSRSPDDNPY
ncbi:MAG TPA: TIGR02266 family protein [Polyangiaceae bacterium]|nr:TIGR02266 family protein [Polyangiaceae bacterium]